MENKERLDAPAVGGCIFIFLFLKTRSGRESDIWGKCVTEGIIGEQTWKKVEFLNAFYAIYINFSEKFSRQNSENLLTKYSVSVTTKNVDLPIDTFKKEENDL